MIGRVNVGGGGEVGPTYTIKKWCATVGYDYANLDDIPETAMRILMTKYASVAYFMEWYSADSSMIDAFIANQYAMKWIGHRDYICDKLLAITDFKTKALASEYWEYILKDHVPIMTSDSAPYGTAFASTEYTNTTYPNGLKAWMVFDGIENNQKDIWHSSSGSCPHYIGYKFTNPICVKNFYFVNRYNENHGGLPPCQFVLQGSNDTTTGLDGTWDDLQSYTNNNSSNDGSRYYFSAPNDAYYMAYRIKVNSVNPSEPQTSANCNLSGLQFFGRSLNVSVPTMISNTSPYGEIFASGEYDSNRSKLKAFDGAVQSSSSMGWLPSPSDTWGNAWIDYLFTSEISLKQVYVSLWNGSGGGTTLRNIQFKMVGVNGDGSTEDISSALNIEYSGIGYYFAISNIKAFKRIRFLLVGTSGSASTTSGSGYKLQFYGVDYSERTDRTYLYDHGLEFEDLTGGFSRAENSSSVNYTWLGHQTNNTIDFTSYTKMWASYEYNKLYPSNTSVLAGIEVTSGGAQVNTRTQNPPSLFMLDVSNVAGNYKVNSLLYTSDANITKTDSKANDSLTVSLESSGTYKGTLVIHELWLER